ncbi:hypothetical protein PPYR_03367 [Photinus pyralis]|uniref:Alkaline phosphatase n=1 Tax=Photinus pyralis TaxID=7054 RepID=A0A1Y1N438_PHOPY|nr:alkaline phosphatase 4-like [Photinus pyralis]XP_031331551.1 alkaline phosphatase 4-like [Photinus pyralis]XP_031331552.1 alkaline phosphatase 4-like [Photinus pyralis]KAB0791567.1 hypothetical protein PPYR_03367 [Photinus pyralis]
MTRTIFLFALSLLGTSDSATFPKYLNKHEIEDNGLYTENYPEIRPASEEDLLKQDERFWFRLGSGTLKQRLKGDGGDVPKVARNVVFFLADGMGATTTTAGRIYKGQRAGKLGEEHSFSFEEFPNVALVKNYCVDQQVPDSGATATALFSGVKTRYKTIGVDAKSFFGKFDKATYERSKLDSFMVWAQDAGKATGIVTTTRITHATPAATYARTPHRDWECDSSIPRTYRADLKDIARQLVEDAPGKNFKVILGGGLEALGYAKYPNASTCPREDGLNLTARWLGDKSKASFVVGKAQLNRATEEADYLLGLFAPSHLPYELSRKRNYPDVPSLSDMTRAALKVLRKEPKGFALMVEAGLIDRAHHSNLARFALGETDELDEAVAVALRETGTDTLIIVTSDHAHPITLKGYPARGNDIFGFANESVPYQTLSYAIGPGFEYHYNANATKYADFPWRDLFADESRLRDPFYQQHAGYYRYESTHSGEDVPIYSKGPGTDLLRGVVEQNYVAHVISYAACIGPHARLNSDCGDTSRASVQLPTTPVAILALLLVPILY